MLKNVDILAVLEQAMERNTRHYRSDFQFDREIILKAAAEPKKQYLLWLSRPCGTECFYERGVYIVDNYAHRAWLYHIESGKCCVGYAIEITGMREGRPVGNLYKLDLRRHAADVKFESFTAKNLDESALENVLRTAHHKRKQAVTLTMNLSVRPMTTAERMYSYSQSRQLIFQTGCIGYLLAYFDSNEKKLHSMWEDFQANLNDAEFKTALDQVVNALRFNEAYDGILTSRGKLGSYCRKHPESSYGPDSREYGVRVDTEQYAYLLRLNPNKGEYNLYTYCFVTSRSG